MSTAYSRITEKWQSLVPFRGVWFEGSHGELKDDFLFVNVRNNKISEYVFDIFI